MNRNTESHFSQIPQSDFKRSGFDRSCSLKTTFSSGKLIPIYFEECLPGDTVTLDTSLVCRMTTPIYPVMDNCFLDIYYFFVPNRLVWEHWKEFMGEANPQSWDNNPNYEVPFIQACSDDDPDTGYFYHFFHDTLADYFGLPVGQKFKYPARVSQLPFRAYYLIWNEFFRAQALQDPVFIPLGDDYLEVSPISDYPSNSYADEAFGHLALMPVGKFFDYFTSCLPSPQKGQQVMLPLNGIVPVLANDSQMSSNSNPIRYYVDRLGKDVNLFDSEGDPVAPNNLYVDFNSSDVLSINDLRNAITIQHFLEMEARGGSRYTEIIKTFFGVTSPDARLQRPEYLGGTQIPINIDQVVQTSANEVQPSPLGSTGAFSLTGLKNEGGFTYSSTEHGMIIGLCCVRPRHTYQRGIEKKFTRRDRFDYYFPVFDNISEQPVMLSELVAEGSDGTEVFGYQEAWADYRYSQNKVTGGFRFNADDSLSAWVYTDTTPGVSVINDEFIREDPSIIGDTLAYTANENVQFLADFYFKQHWYRPMSVHSVPGLSRI